MTSIIGLATDIMLNVAYLCYMESIIFLCKGILKTLKLLPYFFYLRFQKTSGLLCFEEELAIFSSFQMLFFARVENSSQACAYHFKTSHREGS